MSSYVRVVNIPNRATTGTAEIDTGIPSTGSGWQAKSLQVFTDRQGPAVAVLFDDSPGGVQTGTTEAAPVANQAVTKRVFFPRACKLTELALFAATKPASALGTVLITLKKNGGNTVISAANFSTEGLTDATYTAMTLTTTEADLTFAAGDHLEIVHTSNNADMTGGTGFVVIHEVELV